MALLTSSTPCCPIRHARSQLVFQRLGDVRRDECDHLGQISIARQREHMAQYTCYLTARGGMDSWLRLARTRKSERTPKVAVEITVSIP